MKQPSKKKVVAIKHNMNKKVAQNNSVNKNIWIVKSGDSLWNIAVKKYTSGYNWVDIARVNNLSNPSDIHVGDKLVLPNVPTKTPTVVANNRHVNKTSTKANKSNVQQNYTQIGSAITGNSYTVVHGDNLWNIAVRAYGNGFKWVDIARVNNLANPRVINSGNVLIIPRT